MHTKTAKAGIKANKETVMENRIFAQGYFRDFEVILKGSCLSLRKSFVRCPRQSCHHFAFAVKEHPHYSAITLFFIRTRQFLPKLDAVKLLIILMKLSYYKSGFCTYLAKKCSIEFLRHSVSRLFENKAIIDGVY